MPEFFAPSWAIVSLGGLVILFVLLDVFLTVLYARANRGLISYVTARFTWLAFRVFSKLFGSRRQSVISFCGPSVLVLLIGVWTGTLALGAALVIYPNLGDGVVSSGGDTPTDFVTALYAGGSSLAVVGASDFIPKTGPLRLFYIFDSLLGMSVLSLTLTYLMQVYTALKHRNTFALKIHTGTGGTGDAAELLAGLGPEGRFDASYSNLADMAADMAQVKEAHHFYGVLFFFRFGHSFYSISQTSLVLLDTISLIKSALDDRKYGWLKLSVSVVQLWRGCMLMLQTMGRLFLADGELVQPDPETIDRWRARYSAALVRLRQANIETIKDEEDGFKTYVRLRSEWDCYIQALAPKMAYEMKDIDTAGSRPQLADQRKDFRGRLRSAG
jgi:hypothetical protein